ncbi:MAG TPA: hypothetical protein VNF68_05940 [Candidatus Baltobacteraceae bacterium]|nr:hypothetical protein [Candidatus Baltobacteraceae bacterium]
MSTSTHVLPPVRTAFRRFIDYAGLFPPAKLDMRPALEAYRAAQGGAFDWMLGRFIVPASLLDALDAVAAGSAVDCSVILDAKRGAREWFVSAQGLLERVAGRADVGCLEVPLPPLASKRETYDATIGQVAMLAERRGLRDRPIYVELPRDERWRELLPGAMVALSRYGLGAKLRCGGVVAEAFPDVDEVGTFISAAGAEHVPFKATAGLHHPVRHQNAATGFKMHGFLNLLCASVFVHRVDAATRDAILADETASNFSFDERTLAWRDLRASDEEIAAAREHGFVAYGSCSFDEPLEDLSALSMLPE